MTNKANEGKFSYQYGYDLRNRLATANITRKEGTADVTITSSYAYNANGIRTRALQTINGNTQNRYFLLDDGHTGYAQVFEETAELGGSIVRSYTIGDDVLSQTGAGVTSHLLYDGHGSTRQLADNNGTVTANYAYDAYGKMLGGNPGVTDGKTSATDLLYAGEQFDSGLQMEYLRARYYDQDNGRFNRLDPFEGNSEDPQSLHKYAYAHSDPVNGIDPSGETLVGLIVTMGIISTISGLAGGTLNVITNTSNVPWYIMFMRGFVASFLGTSIAVALLAIPFFQSFPAIALGMGSFVSQLILEYLNGTLQENGAWNRIWIATALGLVIGFFGGHAFQDLAISLLASTELASKITLKFVLRKLLSTSLSESVDNLLTTSYASIGMLLVTCAMGIIKLIGRMKYKVDSSELRSEEVKKLNENLSTMPIPSQQEVP